MHAKQKANILLVDDQPGKLASYEVILSELDENLFKASSAKEALEILLKNDVAVILVDVCMPELDGFELARMIREHPRFKETAIIFISAVVLSELDSLRAYDLGAVDYVSVPVVPGILRAKVRVFVDLYRKTHELARVNDDLEARVRDRTAELEAAIAQQELLAREVDHRARNALAVIQSIVTMMPPSSGPTLAKVIEGRIRAMARAHTLLSQTRWEGADLASLVDEELEPYRAVDRITIKGPAVAIRPAVAQNFALAIHEMATNAAKYGALSAASGRLDVSWSLEADRLVLRWSESSGPVAAKPQKLGFGSKVIDASIKRQLGGTIVNEWTADGLRSTLSVPSEHFTPWGITGHSSRKAASSPTSSPRHASSFALASPASTKPPSRTNMVSSPWCTWWGKRAPGCRRTMVAIAPAHFGPASTGIISTPSTMNGFHSAGSSRRAASFSASASARSKIRASLSAKSP